MAEEPIENEMSKMSVKDEGSSSEKIIEEDVEYVSNIVYDATSTFEEMNLHPKLLENLSVELKYERPKAVQASVVPVFLGEDYPNVVAQSQNGTGKTLVLLLGMAMRCDFSRDVPQALCLCHTNELADATFRQATSLLKDTGLRVCCVSRSAQDLKNPTEQLLIATPGKLKYLMKSKSIDLSQLKVFVLDEADEMMSKFEDDILFIFGKLKKDKIQVLLLSATFPDSVLQLTNVLAPKNVSGRPLVEFFLREESLVLDTVKQFYVDNISPSDRLNVLETLYRNFPPGSVIIFCATRKGVKDVGKRLVNMGFDVQVLHGAMDIHDRLEVCEQFRIGKSKILVSTDVLARGYDSRHVTVVINFDMPIDPDGRPNVVTYLHRVGRTGRMGRTGISINLLSDKDNQRAQDRSLKFHSPPPSMLLMR